MGKKIDLRRLDRCLEKTKYLIFNEDGSVKMTHSEFPTCVYYDIEKGCTLNGCIKNFKK